MIAKSSLDHSISNCYLLSEWQPFNDAQCTQKENYGNRQKIIIYASLAIVAIRF